MNILHHKSWHVFNKDNIEKVRKDEENARKEEEAKQKRVALAEQEARTAFLRKKARERQGIVDEPDASLVQDVASVEGAGSHINFFYDEEQAQLQAEKDAKEKEARSEQEKWEKKVGILVGLGQSASESTGVQPFYAKPAVALDQYKVNDKDQAHKALFDPLLNVRRYVDEKHKALGMDNPIETSALMPASLPIAPSNHKRSRSKSPASRSSKKSKKHKEKKRKKQDYERAIEEDKATRLARLREERLARERAERSRAEALCKPQSGPKVDNESKYHNQFNPTIARQNRPRSS